MSISGICSRMDQLVIRGTFRFFIISRHRWSLLICLSTITWLLAPSGRNTWTGDYTRTHTHTHTHTQVNHRSSMSATIIQRNIIKQMNFPINMCQVALKDKISP